MKLPDDLRVGRNAGFPAAIQQLENRLRISIIGIGVSVAAMKTAVEAKIEGEREMKNIRLAAVSTSAVICAAVCITIGGMATATPARAQAAPSSAAANPAAAATTSKIHGHAQDPLY